MLENANKKSKTKLYIAGPTCGKSATLGFFIKQGLRVFDTDWLMEIKTIFPEWLDDDLYQKSRKDTPLLSTLSDWKDAGTAFFINSSGIDVVLTNLWGQRFLTNLDPQTTEIAGFVGRDNPDRIKALSDQRGSRITLATATHWVANFKKYAEPLGIIYLTDDEFLIDKVAGNDSYDLGELEALHHAYKIKFLDDQRKRFSGKLTISNNR